MNDEARCRSCNATPHLVTDENDTPTGFEWRHTARCERDIHEQRRLNALAQRRGENPGGMQFTKPQDVDA